jgi:hypothetical protein
MTKMVACLRALEDHLVQNKSVDGSSAETSFLRLFTFSYVLIVITSPGGVHGFLIRYLDRSQSEAARLVHIHQQQIIKWIEMLQYCPSPLVARDPYSIPDMIESLGEIFQSTDFDVVDGPVVLTGPAELPGDVGLCVDWGIPLNSCYDRPTPLTAPDPESRFAEVSASKEAEMVYECRVRFLSSAAGVAPKGARAMSWGPETDHFNNIGNGVIVPQNSVSCSEEGSNDQ